MLPQEIATSERPHANAQADTDIYVVAQTAVHVRACLLLLEARPVTQGVSVCALFGYTAFLV